jgi:hypothetical protein
MTKSRLIFVAVLALVVLQALLAARYGVGGGQGGPRTGFFEGGGGG